MSVKVQFREDRQKWQVTYYVDSKRKRPLFLEELEAQNFARRVRLGLLIESDDSITNAEAAKTYFQSESVKKNQKSRANDRRYLNLFEHFMYTERGIERLKSVGLQDMESFRDWLLIQTEYDDKPMRMGASTVNRCLRVMKHFFKRHVQWQNRDDSPCLYLDFLEAEEKPRVVMSIGNYLQAFEKTPEWFRPVLRFIMLTGAPPVCVERLTWADVDLVGRRYWILRKKGKKARLKRVELPMAEAVFAEFVLKRNADLSPDGLVFKNEFGRKLRADLISRTANEAIRAAGIKGVTLYGLRHALASDMTTAGIPTEVVRQAMGHANISTTQRYANKVQLTAITGALETVRGGRLVAND